MTEFINSETIVACSLSYWSKSKLYPVVRLQQNHCRLNFS